MSDWLVLVGCSVNIMLSTWECWSFSHAWASTCGVDWLLHVCYIDLEELIFVSKDEREMWQIVSWECGILVVNRQVVVHAFAWLESQLFKEASFVDLCLVDVYTTRCKSTWWCSHDVTFVSFKKQKEDVIKLYYCMNVFQG